MKVKDSHYNMNPVIPGPWGGKDWKEDTRSSTISTKCTACLTRLFRSAACSYQ